MSSNLHPSIGKKEISPLPLHKVRVEDIPEQGLDVRFVDPSEAWKHGFEEIPSREFSVTEDVEGTFSLRVCGKAIRIEGSVHAGLGLQCCRCLELFAHPLISQIDVTLFPEADAAPGEEIELGHEDLETSFFSGDEIDLSGLVREQIILNIPYKALCREACRGLCPHCGANLNEGDCGCEGELQNSAFDVLRNLKLDGT